MRKKTLTLSCPALLFALLYLSCAGTAGAPRIGLLLSGSSEVAEEARALLTLGHGKAEFLVRDAEGRRQSQAEDLEGILKSSVQVVVLACVDPVDAGAFIERAKAAKVPLLFIGSRPISADLVKWDKAFYIGVSPYVRGQAQGELAASLWARRPGSDRNRDGMLQYAIIRDRPTKEATEMAQGLIAALEAPGKPGQRLADEAADNGQAGAQKLAAAWVGRFGRNLELLLCTGEEGGPGAAEALGQRPLVPPTLILATGQSGQVLSGIASGLIHGSVVEDPEAVAKACLDISMALASRGSPAGIGWTISENKYLWVPPLALTRDNLEAILGKAGAEGRR